MGKRTLLVRFNLGLGYILAWGIPLGYTLSKRTFRDRVYFGCILAIFWDTLWGRVNFLSMYNLGKGILWVRLAVGVNFRLR